MTYPDNYPDMEPCDQCGARVGNLTLYSGIWLCRACLRRAAEEDALRRLPSIEWEEAL